jgi:hypothetical protein
MTSLEEFKEILATSQIVVPEESLEVLRDFIDLQADTILDQWLSGKESIRKGVK